MNPKILKLICLFLFAASSHALAESLPKNILSQIPQGYAVLSFKSGELNNDKLSDFIVVLREEDEASFNQQSSTLAPARPLLIFIQNSGGNFTLAKRNDNVVFKINEGGQCDPFESGAEGLAIKNLYFTVQNSVSCGQHWSVYITFRYAPELHDWVFHKRIGESLVMNTSKDPNAELFIPGPRTVVAGKGKPPVLFEKYRSK